ncbi:Helitron helicase-like domain [Trinorchestia longiramus]|nr:Helitron helicase-like domain [Trinorchestia longiramus]
MEYQIHYTGAMDVQCKFYGALRFQREQLNCCHNGKVLLPPLQEYPENLRLLFDADGAEGSNFRQNIRNYNSAFAFASFAAYHNIRAIEQQEQERAVINMPPRQVTKQFIPGPDRRKYNNPTGNEVAAIFVGDDGAPPMYRDIVVYPIGLQRHRIAYISCHLDPMVYPLLFPNGEPGCHINMPHVEQRQTRVRNKVTMQEFYSYRLAIRDDFSALHRAGKLLQQYIVDAYVKVEGCRLNFIKNHQAQLRVALYSGLMDYLDRQNDNQQPGVPVILPSTLTGSLRNMQQAYQDAMAIVCKFRKPDIFLTYTCNSKCREITENLGLHETAQTRFSFTSLQDAPQGTFD